MDVWDYAWLLSSELLVALIVLGVAGFNLYAFNTNQIADKSLANKFLGYHSYLNPDLYKNTTSTKLIVQSNSPLSVAEAFASETGPDLPPPTGPINELETVSNDNSFVAQNFDSNVLLERQVKVYVTERGDTLASIAKKFGISKNTIMWANNLTDDQIKTGWQLAILSEDGVLFVATKNTTLPDLARKCNVPMERIMSYNGMADPESFDEGDYIICPGGHITPPPKPAAPVVKRSIGVNYDQIPNIGKGNSFPTGYCTYYVARQVKVTWRGHAKYWLSNAAAQGYATGKNPKVGSIYVSWDNKKYGHVALVEQVEEGRFLVSEMNYKKFGVKNTRWVTTGNKLTIGFVYIK